jgi:hypothetical protein
MYQTNATKSAWHCAALQHIQLAAQSHGRVSFHGSPPTGLLAWGAFCVLQYLACGFARAARSDSGLHKFTTLSSSACHSKPAFFQRVRNLLFEADATALAGDISPSAMCFAAN